MSQLVILLVICMASTVLSQGQNPVPYEPKPPSPGPCPEVPVVENFNLHAYLGRWYEQERFFNPFQYGDCVTADYGLYENGTISVVNSDVDEGELNTIFGIATPGSNASEARLVVEFPSARGGGGSFSPMGIPNYNVVVTDYMNYAVVYSCASFNDNKLEFSWILARRPKGSPKFIAILKQWLKKNANVDSDRFEPTPSR